MEQTMWTEKYKDRDWVRASLLFFFYFFSVATPISFFFAPPPLPSTPFTFQTFLYSLYPFFFYL